MLFRKKEVEKDYIDDLPAEEDEFDHLIKIENLLRDQTKLIKEMYADLKSLREDVFHMQAEIVINNKKDAELSEIKNRLYDMVAWVQIQFVAMLSHTKEKAEEPKVSPAVRNYLARRDATPSTNGKLPLPG